MNIQIMKNDEQITNTNPEFFLKKTRKIKGRKMRRHTTMNTNQDIHIEAINTHTHTHTHRQ